MTKKSGFTLVEIMVAIAVTMIALATAVLLLRDSTRANSNVTQTADMSDNLRAGLNLILPAIEPGNNLGPTVTSPDGTSGPRTDIITILYADNTLALNQKAI